MFKISAYETYKDGHVIFEEGSNGDGIYAVEKGEVEISKKIGGERLVIEVLKAGDIFGELAYLDKESRSATATAKGETVVGIIERDFFDWEYNQLSPPLQNVIKTVAFRLRKTIDTAVKG
jgi:CRP-like cAMP-binding protein